MEGEPRGLKALDEYPKTSTFRHKEPGSTSNLLTKNFTEVRV